MEFNLVTILGAKVHLLTMEDLNQLVIKKMRTGEKYLISNHNLHSVHLFHRDELFKKSYDLSNLIHIDGMPLVLWGKLTGRHSEKKHRITYLDWIHPLLKLLNDEGCRVFYLGSKEGVAQKAVDQLEKLYPKITFKVQNGFFDVTGLENDMILNDINRFQPHVLMIGMGMPRQEKWIYNNFEQLSNSIILPCGACFDYLAGEVKTPPRWLGKFYLEWFYRFFFEPKRLFKRYFIEPVLLFPYFVRDIFKK